MNNMSLKEKAILAILGMVAMYALAIILWFTTCESAWTKAAKNYKKAKDTYTRECSLIAKKALIADEYESEKAQMPTFEYGKATATTWLRKIDDVAAKHHLTVGSTKGGKESENGDVLELPIEVSGWEGSLKSLVEFMYELETTDEGMFDIATIKISPISSKKGYLKGSLTVNCAYMREDKAE